MPATRFARRTFQKKIDFKQWTAVPGLVTALSASIGTVILGSVAFAVPATILRMRGRMLVFFDESAQIADQALFAFGLAVVSTDAATAGAGSLPDPSGEPEFPWIYWTEFAMSNLALTEERPFGVSAREIVFDSKAMRKVKPGESLQMVGSSLI